LCYSFVLVVLFNGDLFASNARTKKSAVLFYCPVCAAEVGDPLTCGDCSAVICRRCGSPLESSDELGMDDAVIRCSSFAVRNTKGHLALAGYGE